MALTLADLFASPDHLLYAFAGEDAVFVPMDRAAYERSIFLDDRISAAESGHMRVPIDQLLPLVPAPQPAAWIFHVAHCGSTLLARAIEALGAAPVLREPLALRQVAVDAAGALLPLTLAMLGKRYDPQMPALIKANVPVNFILPDIAAVAPPVGAILLYHGFADHLAAALRTSDRRGWLRRVTAELAPYLGDLTRSSDAQRAAALWAAQIARMAVAARALPRARALAADSFYAQPAATLLAAATALGLPADAEHCARIADGPLFGAYSKSPAIPFDDDARRARRADDLAQLAAACDEAEEWLARHAPRIADDLAALGEAALRLPPPAVAMPPPIA